VNGTGGSLIEDPYLGQRLFVFRIITNFDQGGPQIQRAFELANDVIYHASDVLLKKVRIETVEGFLETVREKLDPHLSLGVFCRRCRRLGSLVKFLDTIQNLRRIFERHFSFISKLDSKITGFSQAILNLPF
jgi:hypothetical protein